MKDYTLANVPDSIERGLERVARERRISPEQAAVELIAEALGVDEPFEYVDLDELLVPVEQ
jgi:hypothetical protein